ncbi:MAG: hypothetical protein OXC13_12420 [Caldilineaceae bacterium]|nr:hypothetical protein [Caldilineaceae bacterium]
MALDPLMRRRSVGFHLLTYVYLLLSFAAGFLAAWTLRDAVRLVLTSQELDRYLIHGGVIFTTFAVVGIGTLIFLVVAEHRFRTSADLRSQLGRFLAIVSVPLLVAGVAHLVQGLISILVFDYLEQVGLLLALGELTLGVWALVWRSRRSGRETA